jgi:NAD(P)-dependent dehydrogenase (short-subunit alcohol dehydrogenase family)
LGVTFARALAGAGARYVLAARSADKLQAVSQSILEMGGMAQAIPCDVSDPEQVEATVTSALERFGRVDILVNNAGVVPDGGMMPERLPRDVFEQTVRTNLLGTWYGCRAVGTRMLRDGKGGSIINIASIAGLTGLTDFPVAYQATKAAVINLTRNLACSWADRGVRVNAMAPGWFPSEMTAPWLGFPPFLAWATRLTPMGRVGDAEELIGRLLFLASDASSFVTGHTLVVNGGYTASSGATPFPGDTGKRIRPS